MSNIQRISLPLPPLGGKCFVIEKKGTYILDEGPCLLRVIACTHAGAGGLMIYDGVPDQYGYFGDIQPNDPKYFVRNGRPLFRAHPVVMGSWALDAGALHGLTIVATGGEVDCIVTIVWIPVKRSQ